MANYCRTILSSLWSSKCFRKLNHKEKVFYFLLHSAYLEKHKMRIEWQLERLYRIRNIATHLGIEVSNAEPAVNHLHNYFDYVINYMLCKSENGQYISDLSALVFESKNDIRIQTEALKENKNLSLETYKLYLLGPDIEIINYNFEH